MIIHIYNFSQNNTVLNRNTLKYFLIEINKGVVIFHRIQQNIEIRKIHYFAT